MHPVTAALPSLGIVTLCAITAVFLALLSMRALSKVCMWVLKSFIQSLFVLVLAYMLHRSVSNHSLLCPQKQSSSPFTYDPPYQHSSENVQFGSQRTGGNDDNEHEYTSTDIFTRIAEGVTDWSDTINTSRTTFNITYIKQQLSNIWNQFDTAQFFYPPSIPFVNKPTTTDSRSTTTDHSTTTTYSNAEFVAAASQEDANMPNKKQRSRNAKKKGTKSWRCHYEQKYC